MKKNIYQPLIVLCCLFFIAACNKQGETEKKEVLMKKKSLESYQEKRDFSKTPEPTGHKKSKNPKSPLFVIQKHAARQLHYDFRLEIDGVLKSWAVPKGPSINPVDKRLAVPTEDHPMAYGSFEGVIPAEEYGAGIVMVWETGTYENIKEKNGTLIPIEECYKKGQIEVFLYGKKLQGGFTLLRMASIPGKRWLLIKMRDEYADDRRKPVVSEPNSALTGRSMEQIKKEADE